MKLNVFIKQKSYFGKGIYDTENNSILVLKGAQFNKKSSKAFAQSNRYKYYDQMINEGTLDANYVLVKDQQFNSSSLAASLIKGVSSNGLLHWLIEENVSLKDFLDKDVTLEPVKMQETYLHEFLKDIEILEKIETNEVFNIFSTLKIVKTEIRHSNVLAWLLDPYESHGLKDYFTKQLVRSIYLENVNYFKNMNLESIFLWDFDQAEIFREKDNIDILLIDNENHFVLAIENKISSNEHDNQLTRYKEIIKKRYPSNHFKHFFVFLTSEEDEASDNEWINVSYELILKIIEKSLPLLKDNVRVFVQDYLIILRRYIMEDDKLVKLCREIYAKHRNALDLIFQYKPDHNLEITEYIKEKISENDNFILNQSRKNLVRISSKTLEKINDQYREVGHGWVKDNSVILYEIKIQAKKIILALIVGPTKDNTRELLIKRYKSKTQKSISNSNKYTTLDKIDILTINNIEETNNLMADIDKKLLEKVHEFIKNKDQIIESM